MNPLLAALIATAIGLIGIILAASVIVRRDDAQQATLSKSHRVYLSPGDEAPMPVADVDLSEFEIADGEYILVKKPGGLSHWMRDDMDNTLCNLPVDDEYYVYDGSGVWPGLAGCNRCEVHYLSHQSFTEEVGDE